MDSLSMSSRCQISEPTREQQWVTMSPQVPPTETLLRAHSSCSSSRPPDLLLALHSPVLFSAAWLQYYKSTLPSSQHCKQWNHLPQVSVLYSCSALLQAEGFQAGMRRKKKEMTECYKIRRGCAWALLAVLKVTLVILASSVFNRCRITRKQYTKVKIILGLCKKFISTRPTFHLCLYMNKLWIIAY